MTDRSLTAQIDALQWAIEHTPEMARRSKLRDSQADELVRRLQAALETLRTLERVARKTGGGFPSPQQQEETP